VWGQDVSGSLQGAGGVGGLLMAQMQGCNYYSGYQVTAPSVIYYQYDGNGNISDLLDSSGNFLSHLRYDSFGNRLTQPLNGAWHPWVFNQPWGFSTKWTDDTTFHWYWPSPAMHQRHQALIYYGYRHYTPKTGRWLGRDPIEEAGGVNLFGMVGNQPLSLIDISGEIPLDGQQLDLLSPPGYHQFGAPAEPLGPAKRTDLSWTPREINYIQFLGNLHGCAYCGASASGRPTGNWTHDHMPIRTLNELNWPYKLYPQCRACQVKQMQAAASAKRLGTAERQWVVNRMYERIPGISIQNPPPRLEIPMAPAATKPQRMAGGAAAAVVLLGDVLNWNWRASQAARMEELDRKATKECAEGLEKWKIAHPNEKACGCCVQAWEFYTAFQGWDTAYFRSSIAPENIAGNRIYSSRYPVYRPTHVKEALGVYVNGPCNEANVLFISGMNQWYYQKFPMGDADD
jgi:RHS repeat-associated protein